MGTDEVSLVDAARADALLAEAASAPRRRAHLLLHAGHHDSVQRLLVAFAPGSYVQPHRHTEQWEFVVALRGTLRLLMFSPAGEVTRSVDIAPDGIGLIEVPKAAWHTLLAVSPAALIMEVKPGPYRPADFAQWAPAEADPHRTESARWLAAAEPGMRFEIAPSA